MRITALALTFGLMQFPPEMHPQARATKLSEMIIDRLPWRKIAGEIPLGTPRAQEVKERVEDEARASGGGASHAVIGVGEIVEGTTTRQE